MTHPIRGNYQTVSALSLLLTSTRYMYVTKCMKIHVSSMQAIGIDKHTQQTNKQLKLLFKISGTQYTIKTCWTGSNVRGCREYLFALENLIILFFYAGAINATELKICCLHWVLSISKCSFLRCGKTVKH